MGGGVLAKGVMVTERDTHSHACMHARTTPSSIITCSPRPLQRHPRPHTDQDTHTHTHTLDLDLDLDLELNHTNMRTHTHTHTRTHALGGRMRSSLCSVQRS